MVAVSKLFVVIGLWSHTSEGDTGRAQPWTQSVRSLAGRVGALVDPAQEVHMNSIRSDDQAQMVIGVRKMTEDEGEMFFPAYWTLAESEEQEAANIRRDEHETPRLVARDEVQHPQGNATMPPLLLQPFALHARLDLPESDQPALALIPRNFTGSAPLSPRGFACVDETNPCNSINRPNSCCGAGETCQLIADTGLGDVGCCAQGDSSCSDDVGGCSAGYQSCPGAQGGGCCIPGYSCEGVGCKYQTIR